MSPRESQMSSPLSWLLRHEVCDRRRYLVRRQGPWWRILSEEGEVARYRTREAAVDSAKALVHAMRMLGVRSELVLAGGPGAIDLPDRRAAA